MSKHIPFQNIENSAARHCTKFPRFLTEEYNHSVAEWDKGIRDVKDLREEERMCLQESNKNHTPESSVLRDIKEQNHIQSENGVCDKFLRVNIQSNTEPRSKI